MEVFSFAGWDLKEAVLSWMKGRHKACEHVRARVSRVGAIDDATSQVIKRWPSVKREMLL